MVIVCANHGPFSDPASVFCTLRMLHWHSSAVTHGAIHFCSWDTWAPRAQILHIPLSSCFCLHMQQIVQCSHQH